MKSIYKSEYNIVGPNSKGEYTAIEKTGNKQRHTFSSLSELQDFLEAGADDATTTTTTTTTTSDKYPKVVGEALIVALQKSYPNAKITYDETTGKFTYDGKEYTFEELKTHLKDHPPSAAEVEDEEGDEDTPPRLYDTATMKLATHDTTAEVLAAFKTDTGATATALEGLKGPITISNLIDKGTPNDVELAKYQLTAAQLTQISKLKEGQTIDLTDIKGKKVTAENVDGYIRINVGTQSYILGKTSDGKYNAYQYKNFNGDGYNTKNW